jgi:hypothetical protein
VVAVPPEAPDENVVYLNDESARTGGAIPPNQHAADYDRTAATPSPSSLHAAGPADEAAHVEAVRRRAAELQAGLPAFGSHGPVPYPDELVPPPRVDDNPFGDFFADGPTAWLEDDDDDRDDHVQLETPRLVGAVLAGGAMLMMLIAWAVWGLGMYRGAGGAEAGGFLLLSLLLWIWYLSLRREQQHAAMLRRHVRVQRFVERPIAPLRVRTEGSLALRRERERYRAMRDERSRRISSLGEGAYRAFRQGVLSADLQPGAQRVLAMEHQMLAQDQRIHRLVSDRTQERAAEVLGEGGHGGTDAASGTPGSGHPPV